VFSGPYSLLELQRDDDTEIITRIQTALLLPRKPRKPLQYQARNNELVESVTVANTKLETSLTGNGKLSWKLFPLLCWAQLVVGRL